MKHTLNKTSKNTSDTERRRVVQRLIRKLTSDEFAILNHDYITTASKYTGLHPKALKELETSAVYETIIEPVDRSIIYEKLVHFYTEKNKIPCTYELFNSLYGDIPPYLDIGNFRKILVQMGFVWKKITANAAVVIENPLVRFERYNYLKKIQRHREILCTDIYYIDNGSYDSKGKFRDHKLTKEFLVDVSNKEWVQSVIYALGPEGIHALEDINAFSNAEVEDWVRDFLLPKITKPSIFILQNAEHYNSKIVETPSLDSLKTDIVRWLDKHGVTYDPMMSKYELFALADRYTDVNTDLFKIDQILKAKGHAVLRIPRCINNVTSSALLQRSINENFPEAIVDMQLMNKEDSVADIKALFRDVITTAAALYIEEFERYIARKEAELVAMEDKVDEVYDALMAKAESQKPSDICVDSDLPSCTDSE